MRITKDKETRRAELVDTSMALFLEKGYAATMVSDVVKRVGVAQGTFYYYFETKENVLDAALEKLLRESADRVASLAADEYQTPPQRLEGLFRMLFSPRGSLEGNDRFTTLLQDPVVHTRMEDVRFRLLHDIMKDLIEEGIRSGDFRPLKFPGETAEIALRGAAAFMRDRKHLLTASLGIDATMDALAEFMERLLGLPEESLDFRDRVIRRHA